MTNLVQIAVPASATLITAEVRKLLRAAEVGNRLPTPKDDILRCAELIESGELDLEEFRSTAWDVATGFFRRVASRVLGLLDFRSRVVFVDPSIIGPRKNFITFHEVVHRALPWQNAIYMEDDAESLAPECKDLFESEANYGAADLLFQCERFEREARDFQLAVDSALFLAQKYDASCHAALRRFVERNHRDCVLLVTKQTRRVHEDGQHSFYLIYSIASPSFTAKFGEVKSGIFLEPSEPIGKIANESTLGTTVLSDRNNISHECQVEVFDNQRHKFLLIYPSSAGLIGRTSTIAARSNWFPSYGLI